MRNPGGSLTAWRTTALAVLIALMLTGCVSPVPHRTPTDPGIPEARAAAEAQIADLRSRFRFSDRVIVLGSGQKDSCGTAENWWFDNRDLGYRCWMSWSAVAVIPDAQTPREVAAAVDAEMAALDVPYYPGGMVRSLMSLYPPQRELEEHMPVTGGGYEGSIRFEVSAEAFRPDFWPTPSVEGSGSGDASKITIADVHATGANQIIEFSASTEYWNTAGLTGLEEAGTQDPVNVVFWAYGDSRVIELADWTPAEAPASCAADPAIDQAAVTRADRPFPYLRLAFLPTANGTDQQRVRECILATMTSGSLVTLTPYD